MNDLYSMNVPQLRTERASLLASLDAILATVKEARRSEFTDYERTTVNDLKDGLARVEAELDRKGSARRSSRYGDVQLNTNVTRSGDSRAAGASLDELLWSTSDVTRAGTIDQSGIFRADPMGTTNPVEQVVIRSKSAGDTGRTAPRITAFDRDERDAIRAFQDIVPTMAMFGLMVDKKAQSSADGFEVARAHPMFADRWNDVVRALDVDTSSAGGTWVPTGIGASVVEKVRAMGRVAPLFNRIDLPTNPWKWPIEGGDAVAYRVAEPTSDTATKVAASSPTTIAATFDAEIFGARTIFSRSLDADSAVTIAPYVVGKLARAMAIAEERAILDGDTDGTHQDSDTNTAGATHASWAWDGLRKRALAETTQATTTTSTANLAAIRKSMGKWGLDPAELAFIVGVSSMHVLLADSNLWTVDKMGPNATLLAGQIGSLWGVPVIVSEHIREDLNASGVHDAITSTKTVVMCVNRSQFAIGQRMALDIERDDSIYRETWQSVACAFQRLDFQSLAAASTDDTCAIGYNVTSGS